MSTAEPDGILRLLVTLIRFSGLTQAEIEKRMGVGRGFLQRLRRGEARLTAERVLQILDIIEFSALELVRAAGPFQSVQDGVLLEELMCLRPEARPPAPRPLEPSALKAILDLLREELPPGLVRSPEED